VTSRREPWNWIALGGLPVLVYAEIFLRRNLEHADKYLFSFLQFYYGTALADVFSRPWWQLMLPIREFTGAWSCAAVITHLVETRIGIPGTWYLFNALLVVVSFLSSWIVFESFAFSYTFAICMGFGTQFVHTYAVSGGMASPLIACVFELLLACAYRFVVAERHARWWAAGFAISLVTCALSYEGWLDLAVVVAVAALLFAIVAAHQRAPIQSRRLLAVFASVAFVAVLYVVVKTRLGYGQVAGSESDVVFNYRQWSPLIEDLASNVVTHLYMSVTNFLPPMLTSSTALYEIGADGLVALQNGYHAPYSYLVPMHYLFLWRFAAGAVALGLAMLLVRLIVRTWRQPSADRVTVITGLLMMWLAGSTHALVKIRPMKVTPVMSYHVLVGVIGAALLISYAMLIVWRDWRSGVARIAATAIVWGVLFYGALARPLMLSHLAAQSGLGGGLYPDPMASLLEMFGRSRAPKGGREVYQLMKRPPGIRDDALTPPLMAGLPPLPMTAPDLSQWTRMKGVSVSQTSEGHAVTGNDVGGYQLMSPSVPVPAHHRLLARASGTLDRGKVCLGILDKRQQWLVAPQFGTQELSADTGANDAVSFVFSTCAPEGDVVAPQFHVISVSFAIVMNAEDAKR
jgi:hypothetical protein